VGVRAGLGEVKLAPCGVFGVTVSRDVGMEYMRTSRAQGIVPTPTVGCQLRRDALQLWATYYVGWSSLRYRTCNQGWKWILRFQI